MMLLRPAVGGLAIGTTSIFSLGCSTETHEKIGDRLAKMGEVQVLAGGL